MRIVIGLLVLTFAGAVRAEIAQSVLAGVPQKSLCVVGLRINPRAYVDDLASLIPGGSREAYMKQVDAAAQHSGVNMLEEYSIVFAIDPTAGDPPGVVIGKIKVDFAALGKFVKSGELKDRVNVTADAIELDGGKAVILADGTFFAGSLAAVKAARTGNAAKNALASAVAEKLAANVVLAAVCELPPEMKLPPPPNAPPAIAELAPHVRGFTATATGTELTLAAKFDADAAASAARTQLTEGLKMAESFLKQQEASAALAASAKGPVAALDPAWVGWRIALETFKDMQAELKIDAAGPQLTVMMPHRLTAGSVLTTMPVIGVLAAIAVPNFKAARFRANFRACYANQRTLVGAVEMYNLDKNLKVTNLDAALLQELVKGGYLSKIPDDPGQGEGTADHYVLTTVGGGITCTVHGQVQGEMKGTLNEDGSTNPNPSPIPRESAPAAPASAAPASAAPAAPHEESAGEKLNKALQSPPSASPAPEASPSPDASGDDEEESAPKKHTKTKKSDDD